MVHKKIHLIRHAEAEHNVNHDFYSFPDAVLTHKGKQQCSKLNKLTEQNIQKTAELLVTSPMRRTLQTSLIGLPQLIERLGGKSKVIVLPELQENSSSPADTGSSKEELTSIEEFHGLDFTRLNDGWNSKKGFYSTDHLTLTERANWTRNWLANRPENEIVVVSHGSALKYLTDDFGPHNLWHNTQVKTYTLRPTTITSNGNSCSSSNGSGINNKSYRLVPINSTTATVVNSSESNNNNNKSLLSPVLLPTPPSIEQN